MPFTEDAKGKMSPPPIRNTDMLIGALLRVPAQAIHRRLITELNAAGFEELRVPHMAVLQSPGPDGVRPGTLAERAGISKQAMNQLLHSLEGHGYIVRTEPSDEGRARIIYFTQRGHAAYAKILEIPRTSSANGALSWGHGVSRSSKSCCFASGRAG